MVTKSRVQWLSEGERNTKLFHQSMLQRRHINIITRLENDQGKSLLTHNEIEQELINYYKNILTGA
jgi:hypothetical protein